MRRLLIGFMSVLLCGGCAGVSPAQIGQTAGTIAGAAIAPGVGAPIGALAGLLAGMVVQGQVDKSTEVKERKELSRQLESGSTSGSSSEDAVSAQAQPTRVWVDETVHNGRLTPGHFDVRNLS